MSEEQAEYEVSVIEVAESTMLGDLMSLVVDELKAAPDVWQKLPQHKQQDVIWRVESQVKGAIRQVVNIIAANGRDAIPAELGKISIDKGKAKAELLPHIRNDSEALSDLAAAQGMVVYIVIPYDVANRVGEDGKPLAEPDQPSLIDSGHDEEMETEGEETEEAED